MEGLIPIIITGTVSLISSTFFIIERVTRIKANLKKKEFFSLQIANTDCSKSVKLLTYEEIDLKAVE